MVIAAVLLYEPVNLLRAAFVRGRPSSPAATTTSAESDASVRDESGSLPIMNLYISELSSFGGFALMAVGAFSS
jgi:hypothetical protein